jgi:hypothetical protein
MNPADRMNKATGFRKWFKRIGIIGFFFFLLKGLVWIGVIIATWLGISR